MGASVRPGRLVSVPSSPYWVGEDRFQGRVQAMEIVLLIVLGLTRQPRAGLSGAR